jgi:hypothetical protein
VPEDVQLLLKGYMAMIGFIFIVLLITVVMVVRRGSTRRTNRELAEMNAKAQLWALQAAQAQAQGQPMPKRPNFGRSNLGIMLCLIVLIVLLAFTYRPAHSQELTCDSGSKTTHCWNSRTGAVVTTSEQGAGGYTHTWDAQGRAFTTWDHNGQIHTWRTH